MPSRPGLLRFTGVGWKWPAGWHVHERNVMEWCNDWYDKEYYAMSSADDPTGPLGGSYRVFRGGSWLRPARHCRSADRGSIVPGFRDYDLGFRVARVPADK